VSEHRTAAGSRPPRGLPVPAAGMDRDPVLDRLACWLAAVSAEATAHPPADREPVGSPDGTRRRRTPRW
jgi:hypothetical protein